MGAIKHIRLGTGRASTKKATKTSTPTSIQISEEYVVVAFVIL
jgi:hypothetical protein